MVLFYANSVSVKEHIVYLMRSSKPQPQIVVLDLSESPDLDVGSLDMLDELTDALKAAGAELRIASVRGPALGPRLGRARSQNL